MLLRQQGLIGLGRKLVGARKTKTHKGPSKIKIKKPQRGDKGGAAP